MITAPLTGHLDAALTEFAKRFSQSALVSDLVAPRVPVGRQTDKYWIYGRESQMLMEQQLRATGAAAQRIRMSLSSDNYFCPSHALAADIADEDRAGYASAGDLEQDATQALMDKILLQKEVELAGILASTANVTQNTTLTGASQFSYGVGDGNTASVDPGIIIETGKSAIRLAGVEPNTLVLGEAVYAKLIRHPLVLKAFQYTMPGALGAAQLASYFAIDRVLVARAVQVSKAGVASMVWGKVAVLLYVNQNTSRQDISAAKTFVWMAAPGTVDGIGVITGRNPEVTAKSDIVGVDFYYHQKITAVETCYLIAAAVA